MAFQTLYHNKHSYFSGSFCYYLYLQFCSFNILNKKSYSGSLNNSYASFQNSINYFTLLSLPYCATASGEPGLPLYQGFTITLIHTTIGKTPQDEWSARRWDLYLTTHNTHKRQTTTPAVGFEPTIPAKRTPVDPHLRPRGHWDRPHFLSASIKL
jgi:hypothetical protein